MVKKLFAGPWVGEFGWELFAWQGYLRKLKNDYEIIKIGCRDGHQFLYRDFCHIFLVSGNQYTQTDMWKCYDAPEFDYGDIDPECQIIPPGNYLRSQQVFKRYGTPDDSKSYDLVFHARQTSKCGTDFRNWSEDSWRSLRSQFKDLKCCSIGTKNAAALIEDTDDLRGLDLEDLSNILASSKVLIGPSSGPMHFGSLCGIPHVVWSPKTGMLNNKDRYETIWNPFNTKVAFIEGSWNPSVNLVIKEVEKLL